MGRPVGPGSGIRFGALSLPQAPAPTLPSSVSTTLAVLRLRVAALFAAQLFDFGTFTVMVGRHGIEAEANPLIAQGFMAYGLPLLALTKAALILLVGSILVLLDRPGASPRMTRLAATTVALLAVASGLVGGLSNVLVR
jgi:hypothetical protein